MSLNENERRHRRRERRRLNRVIRENRREQRREERENRIIRREHGLEDYESDTPRGYYT